MIDKNLVMIMQDRFVYESFAFLDFEIAYKRAKELCVEHKKKIIILSFHNDKVYQKIILYPRKT